MKKGGRLYCDRCGERVDPQDCDRRSIIVDGKRVEKVWHHACATADWKTVTVRA